MCSVLNARDVVHRLAVADEEESDAAHFSRCPGAGCEGLGRGGGSADERERIANFPGEDLVFYAVVGGGAVSHVSSSFWALSASRFWSSNALYPRPPRALKIPREEHPARQQNDATRGPLTASME